MVEALSIRNVLAGSYGCMITVLSYFESLEKLKLQLLSKWWYQVGIGRIQTKFMLLTLPLYKKVYYLRQG